MTRPIDPFFDQRIADWLEGDPMEAPDRVLEVVVAALPSVPRRHASRAPWLIGMRSSTRWSLAAAAVIGVIAVGAAMYALRPSQPPVGAPSPTPGASSFATQPANPTAAPTSTVAQPRPASWTATGNMITPRLGATAVLLRNGKVLVFGGAGSSTPCCRQLTSAELYDPATGIWTATGSMVATRWDYTTTLLRDGRVLVAGGVSDNNSSAELYDPGSGTWIATGNMIMPRIYHSATLLPDGRVLVAGGQVAVKDQIVRSAELYDPSTGTWAATGRMLVPGGGAATLLRNGKVLVAGGYDPGKGALSAAELYDPASGTWTTTGSMVTTLGTYGATLLPDGKVLVVGDGREGPSVEIYDPQSGSWSPPPAGTWTHGSGDHLIVLPDGRLVLLGVPGSPAPETYDPSSGTWTETASMSRPTEGYTATLLPDGRVLVAGGAIVAPSIDGLLDPSSIVASAELYDPGSGR